MFHPLLNPRASWEFSSQSRKSSRRIARRSGNYTSAAFRVQILHSREDTPYPVEILFAKYILSMIKLIMEFENIKKKAIYYSRERSFFGKTNLSNIGEYIYPMFWFIIRDCLHEKKNRRQRSIVHRLKCWLSHKGQQPKSIERCNIGWCVDTRFSSLPAHI